MLKCGVFVCLGIRRMTPSHLRVKGIEVQWDAEKDTCLYMHTCGHKYMWYFIQKAMCRSTSAWIKNQNFKKQICLCFYILYKSIFHMFVSIWWTVMGTKVNNLQELFAQNALFQLFKPQNKWKKCIPRGSVSDVLTLAQLRLWHHVLWRRGEHWTYPWLSKPAFWSLAARNMLERANFGARTEICTPGWLCPIPVSVSLLQLPVKADKTFGGTNNHIDLHMYNRSFPPLGFVALLWVWAWPQPVVFCGRYSRRSQNPNLSH